MSYTIQAENLSKSFNNNVILSDVNFQWEGGKVYGLIGRNGSGKTLLMRMICGLTPVSSGSLIVNGVNITQRKIVPPGIGAVIETPSFLPAFSGFRNLCFLAELRGKIGKDEVRQAMETVGLDPRMRKHVGKYSLGMRQRLGLAQATMEDPGILILDEPMNGLDADGITMVHNLIDLYRKKGRLIILASHMIDDVMATCDKVYAVKDGKLQEKEAV